MTDKKDMSASSVSKVAAAASPSLSSKVSDETDTEN